ncbi:MAG TPA: hypothetical protein VFK05_27250 [Polyangiaceae bacterium]|nr:hypothetical protein [Polyangiaceae bacterium]
MTGNRFAFVRAASAVLLLALTGFVLLTGLAAWAYPGGTYCEPNATSYRFWGNFFCDLTGKVSVRGEDNARSAALAAAAFASFSCAAAPFFWLLADMAGRPAVRYFGYVSALATLLLAWLPSRSGPTLHAIAVFSATLPGLTAAGLGLVGLMRRRSYDRHAGVAGALGISTFVAGLGDAAGYVYALETHADCVPWLPALQKLVALLLLAWMSWVAVVSAAATKT